VEFTEYFHVPLVLTAILWRDVVIPHNSENSGSPLVEVTYHCGIRMKEDDSMLSWVDLGHVNSVIFLYTYT
jgi:hypothetical protein